MVAIKGGKIYTITQGIINDGTILIEDGKIIDIGKNVKIPNSAEIIYAQNYFITPGFIDAHSHISLWGEPCLYSNEDENESTNPITPYLRSIDSLNPYDPAIKKVRDAGFTTMYTGPGSANIIGGTGVSIKLRGNSADEMVIPNSEHMKIALGENPKRVYGQNKKIMPLTRMGISALLRKTLFNASNYSEQLKLGETDPSKLPKPDFELESLVKVVRGEQKVRIHCHRSDDILTAIRICEEYKLNYVLEHVTEGYKVSNILSHKNVSCVVGPFLTGPLKQELWESNLENANLLFNAGIDVCLSADCSSKTMWLPMEIGILIKNGLSEENAFKGITINPAKVLGIESKVGSLEKGKDADIAIFDGFPFCNLSSCVMTMIDGKVYHNTL